MHISRFYEEKKNMKIGSEICIELEEMVLWVIQYCSEPRAKQTLKKAYIYI